MDKLLTFKKFNDPALAQGVADMLNNNGIEYTLDEIPAIYSPSIVNQTELLKEYELKINGGDFNKASALLADYENSFINNVEPDYYLFSFTNEELTDIISKPDEWSAFDYELSKKLLNERGVGIDKATEKKLSEHRLEELKQPEEISALGLVAAYASTLLGGIIGFFVGWHMWRSKKTLPNGEEVYSFNSNSRQHGKWIFILSVICLMVILYYRFIYRDNYFA